MKKSVPFGAYPGRQPVSLLTFASHNPLSGTVHARTIKLQSGSAVSIIVKRHQQGNLHNSNGGAFSAEKIVAKLPVTLVFTAINYDTTVTVDDAAKSGSGICAQFHPGSRKSLWRLPYQHGF